MGCGSSKNSTAAEKQPQNRATSAAPKKPATKLTPEQRKKLEKLNEDLKPREAALLTSAGFDQIEASKVYNAFVDLQENGVLEFDRFNDALARLHELGLKQLARTPFAEQLFKLFDANNDGKIQTKEFCSGLAVLCKGSAQEKFELTFKAYDLDSNGAITKQEMVQMFHQTYEAALKTLYASPTSNGFGAQVDKDLTELVREVSTMFKEMVESMVDFAWEQWDKDKNGKLTLDEFKDFCMSDPNVSASLNGLTSVVKMSLVSL